MCRPPITRPRRVHIVDEGISSPDDGAKEKLPLFNISVVKLIKNQAGFMVEVKIDQILLIIVLDTGTSL